MTNMNNEIDLLANVASLYYTLNQSQAEIAKRLELSPSKVSRLIKEARERGIVEIRVHMPIPRHVELEESLIQTFGLKDAYVLQNRQTSQHPQSGEENNSKDTSTLEQLGQLAGLYLARIIATFEPGTRIGIAWGTGVHASILALPDQIAQDIDVAPLLGGVGALAVDGPDLGRIIAEKLGGRHYDLHAPVLVEKASVRNVFLAEPAVNQAIQRAQSVSLAITGIGSIKDEASSFLRVGLLSREELAALRQQGLVGELCGRFFDSEGNTDYAFNHRVIGIELEQLRTIPRVLAVAYGPAKVDSILGALRGQYLTVLATDEPTAAAVLAANKAQK